MWQLFDIAYVIPVCVGLGYCLGKYLDSHYGTDSSVTCIMIATACGFVLTIVKIKRYIDSENSTVKSKK